MESGGAVSGMAPHSNSRARNALSSAASSLSRAVSGTVACARADPLALPSAPKLRSLLPTTAPSGGAGADVAVAQMPCVGAGAGAKAVAAAAQMPCVAAGPGAAALGPKPGGAAAAVAQMPCAAIGGDPNAVAVGPNAVAAGPNATVLGCMLPNPPILGASAGAGAGALLGPQLSPLPPAFAVALLGANRPAGGGAAKRPAGGDAC